MKPAHRIEQKRDGRVILFGSYYAKMKAELRKLADNHCEQCRMFTLQGDVHHPKGRGGGKRDDRIFVNGERNLFYFCRKCHGRGHVPDKVIPAKPTTKEFQELIGLSE